jgi:hypothetical protein
MQRKLCLLKSLDGEEVSKVVISSYNSSPRPSAKNTNISLKVVRP